MINGHKWFTSNGSSADFLVLMAVTNPDVHPYQATSMIVVPTDTPGVDIVRDVPTMGEPEVQFGRYGNHSEVYYRDARVPYENLIGKEGEGFVLAQKRLGPGRIHHCMRWLGQSRRAFDMLCERALSRYALCHLKIRLTGEDVYLSKVNISRMRLPCSRRIMRSPKMMRSTPRGRRGRRTVQESGNARSFLACPGGSDPPRASFF